MILFLGLRVLLKAKRLFWKNMLEALATVKGSYKLVPSLEKMEDIYEGN